MLLTEGPVASCGGISSKNSLTGILAVSTDAGNPMLYDCFSTFPKLNYIEISCRHIVLRLARVASSAPCCIPIICDERTPKIDGIYGVLTSDLLLLVYQGKQSKRQNSGPGVKGEYQAFSHVTSHHHW